MTPEEKAELIRKAKSAITEQTGPVQCERLKQGRFPEVSAWLAYHEAIGPDVAIAVLAALDLSEARAEKAEACCAEMREALEHIGTCLFCHHHVPKLLDLVVKAKSTDCGSTFLSEREADRKRIGELEGENERLQKERREILREDTPWPLRCVIGQLVCASEHLLSDHDCDLHGHELVRHAITIATEILASAALTKEPT